MDERNESEEIQPHENDVLMGRGGKNNQHVGNEKLRGFARLESENYRIASKKGKSNISRELVKKVRKLDPSGRFLKKNNLTGGWEDVGDDIAREKSSQVLRDAVSFSTVQAVDETPQPIQQYSTPFDEFPRASSAPPLLRDPSRRRHWEETSYTTPPHYPMPPQMMPPDFYPPRAPESHSDPSAKRPRYHTNQWEDHRAYYPRTPVRYYYSQAEYRRPFPIVPTSPLVHSGAPSDEHVSPSNLTTSSRSLPESPLLHSRMPPPDEHASPSTLTASTRSIPPSPLIHRMSSYEHASPRKVLTSVRSHTTLEDFDLFHGELLKSDEGDDDKEDKQPSENVQKRSF
mmetsp:Transcript_23254/g.34333  ORF Transcript_23254/g.34333 Transcript_23254/m.34333 type:complete len:343 (-) Transcript_23254:1490-2518(-)|eukprot:CAMPEP_0194218840 /NCGR_PEP_ID=MMETSP0156-20130528/24603_1 /TAXON_ID=33649 /ORGANISM="Thalassionema nitzschioides, Strain L26-B" /LENGTH=342 /DNA_ID=CAMNT_0038948315 /DNA_START=305 /DNA_END=1333 /DNA_ORIENTATION=+